MTFTTWLKRTTIALLSSGVIVLPAQAGGENPQAYELDIEALPLIAAVKTLSDETGIEVLFFSEIAEGVTSSPVQGEYTPTEALETMLTSTDLKVVDLKKEGAVASATTASDQGGASDSKNLGPTPVLMAQNQPSQTQTTSSRSSEGGTSIVTGKVTDARTGANLKGAKVTIEETGQWTSTNDLGEFRFVNVPTGSATIVVSYLGYAGQSAVIRIRGGGTSQNFALRGGSEVEEIIVYGQQSARAQSLNQERTAPNMTTVISADQLGVFNGTTISEALRRAPGIAFEPDPVTGDGARIIVRGLEPDLNQVTLNGTRLLDGTGLGRSPDLSGILTESIESVTINKTLLPSHDSNGAGALIEIKTKSPLDRAERFASFGLEYGEADGDFGDEFGVNGTVSGILGPDRGFGLSLSGSYRERSVTRITYDLGQSTERPEVLPLVNEQGETVRQPRDVSPFRAFPFESQFPALYPSEYSSSQGDSDQETLSLTLSAEKRFGQHTSIRFDALYSEDTISSFDASTSFLSVQDHDLGPLTEGGSDIRRILVAEDIGRNDPTGFGSFVFGGGFPGFASRSASLQPSEDNSILSLNVRGDTSLDLWTFDYAIGLSRSERNLEPEFSFSLGNQDVGDTGFFSALVTRDQLAQSALDNVTADGRVISVFPALVPGGSDSFVLPLLSEAGFDFFNSADNFPLQFDRLGSRESFGEEFSFSGDIRRDFVDSPLSYVSVGLEHRASTFESPAPTEASELGRAEFELAGGVTSSDIGVLLRPGILTRVGAESDLASIERGSVSQIAANADNLVGQGLLVLDRDSDPSLTQFSETTEDATTAYVEAGFEWGNLEFIGGVRFEHIEVGSTFFTSPSVRGPRPERETLLDPLEFGQLISDSVDQTAYLPRFVINYNFNENMIGRFGYSTTVSRPQLSNLTSFQRLSLDLDLGSSSTSDRPLLTVQQGNPDLDPARTESFDLSIERYTDSVGVYKASLFYKRTEDPLQNNRVIGGVERLPDELALPDIEFFNDLPDPIEVQVVQPVNGEDDNEIWGIELTAERQLIELPGVWSGFGIYTNYTYTDSSSTQNLIVNPSVDPRGFVEFSDVPFAGSPEHQGTFGVTYSKYGFDGSLLYTAQSRRFSTLRAFGLDGYDDAIDTLDLRLDYNFEVGGGDFRAFIRGEDLLSDSRDPYLQTTIGGEDGVPEFNTGSTYFGGRSIFIGMSVAY